MGAHVLEVDVLIVGGGIAGLFLLSELKKRQSPLSVLLVEKGRLGGEQTCHSHVYIHGGYNYNDKGLMCSLRDIRQTWERWLADRPHVRRSTESFWGFSDRDKAQRKLALWSDPDVGLEAASEARENWPAAFESSEIEVLYRTPERCLDGRLLVEELASGNENSLRKIEDVTAIDAHIRGENVMVNAVDLLLPGDRKLHVQPGALVLAAGAGNASLIDLSAAGRAAMRARLPDMQQIRKAHMLVVRGKHLPELTGVFPDLGGLFIVSRRDPETEECVWLISDYRSPPVASPEDWLANKPGWWLPLAIAFLRRLAPAFFEDLNTLHWAVYEAPKAEGRSIGGKLPTEERVAKLGENFWCVWPSKLTLAPAAAATVAGEIDGLLGTVRVPSPPVFPGSTPHVADEWWKRFPGVGWPAFCDLYLVEGVKSVAAGL